VGRLNGRNWQVVGTRQSTVYPVQYPLTQGAFVDVDEVEGDTHLRCLASVNLSAPPGSGIWLYAQSQVCDRPETFLDNLPVLMQVWGSAETSPAEFQRRYAGILGAMAEIGDILAAGRASAGANVERGAAATIEALRGTRLVEEIATGRDFDVELADVSELVAALNAMPGSPGYVEIPLAQRVR
jgi:hypothetical protein